MIRNAEAAEAALLRYYNGASVRKGAIEQFGPLWEALSMVKAGFDVQTNPFLHVSYSTVEMR